MTQNLIIPSKSQLKLIDIHDLKKIIVTLNNLTLKWFKMFNISLTATQRTGIGCTCTILKFILSDLNYEW